MSVGQKKPAHKARRKSPRQGSLGLRAETIPEIVSQIKRGLSYSSLEHFQEASRLPVESIAQAIQIPRRTLARRKDQGRFRPDESERLLRLARVFDRAVDLFEGNAEHARQWMQTPVRGLGDQTPLTFVQTEVGAREVEDLIGRLEHGVFA